jgi:hypothetical protein
MLLSCAQDIKTAWDEYTAVYNKFDDTKRAVSVPWLVDAAGTVVDKGRQRSVAVQAPVSRVLCCAVPCVLQ